jgi:predicted RNase H-like HicB family nuclease
LDITEQNRFPFIPSSCKLLNMRAMKRKLADYTLVVERDPDSGWLVAEVVELPGCYTQAPNLMALDKNVREAIAVYLATKRSYVDAPEFVGTWKIRVPA